MKKSLFKFLSISLAISTIGTLAGFSMAFANMNKNTSKNISAAPINSSLSNTTESSNTWSDQSLISSNDYLSNTNTPNGYLTITNKSINMITWFGTQSWSYDVSNSPFIKQISNYNSSSSIVIHVYYLAHYDRILVYGSVNSTTYIFQLNSDGSEYYVNNDDKNKVQNSSLISGKDQELISSGYSLHLLSQDSAIILPKSFQKSDASVNATKFTFSSFSATPVSYDISGWKTSSNVTDKETYGSDYTLGSIVGFSESSNSQASYLMVSASSPYGSSNTYVSILFIKFTNNIFTSIDKSVVSGVSGKIVNLEKAYFKSVNTIVNGSPLTYVSMLTNISDSSSLKVGPDSNLYDGWGDEVYPVIELVPNSGFINSYYVKKIAQCMMMDIYINPYNARPYVLVKQNSYNLFYFSDLLTNKNNTNSQDSFLMRVVNWNKFPTVNTDTDTSRIDLIWRPIFEKNVNDLTKLNGLVSVLNYSNGATTPSSSSTKKFSITFNMSNTKSNTQSVDFTDFHATVINSYNDLSSQYYYLLPQDVTNEIFGKFIYLKNVTGNSTDKPFNSSVSIPKDGLTILNDSGTINGTVNLDITKWWVTSTNNNHNSSNVYTIPISIDISGLATNASLNFSIVKNSDIDSNKYNTILDLQKNKYPSQITSTDILNSFLVKGNSIHLETTDISMIDSTKPISKTTEKYINVVANDNEGTLTISYNLSSIMSPSISVKSGSYTFNNFKHLNAWNKISIKDTSWNALKVSKSPFQISVSDIISCLDLSSGYNTNPSYWTWKPNHDEKSNKSEYIKDNLDGKLTGTLTYDRTKGQVASSVPNDYTTFNIDDKKGSGFLPISKLLGSDSDTTLYYNENNASKLASSYDLDKVQKDFGNILSNSLVFYNNWTTYESMNYEITSSLNNKIVFTMSYKDTIQTNLKKSDDTNLILDSDWINSITSSNNNVLALAKNYEFDYNLTAIKYNYDLTSSNNTINIDSILHSSTTMNHNYEKTQPSKFISKFYNSQTNDYSNFLNVFNLINLPTDKSAINYYYVSNVQLTGDNTNGTVTAYYTFIFPNAGDSSGSSSTSSIVLNGFLTNKALSHDWLFRCTIIVASFLVILTIGTSTTFLYKKVNNSKRKKYGHGSRRDDLNLEYAERNIKGFKIHKVKVRNTINKNTINNGINKTSDSVKSYNKKISEMKKYRSIKEDN